MKTILSALFVLLYSSLCSQDFNTMTGDWIRVDARYSDGEKVPFENGASTPIRYFFSKKNEVYVVFSGGTIATTYSRSGNVLKIAPIQVFRIEEYSEKALTLIEAQSDDPIRHFMIRTDSFQVAGKVKYPFEVVGSDSIYSNVPGIEPIYKSGNNEFLKYIMMGFEQQVGFVFSFVVKGDGTIGDVTINASTNPKLDKRLIQLVKKTSGKWIPTTYKGKPVNVRIKESIALNGRG